MHVQVPTVPLPVLPPVVLWVPMRLLQTAATSRLKPRLALTPPNPPLSASARQARQLQQLTEPRPDQV
jgi:hypothetical protein